MVDPEGVNGKCVKSVAQKKTCLRHWKWRSAFLKGTGQISPALKGHAERPCLWFNHLVFFSSGCFCVPSWRRIKSVPLKRLNCVAVRSKYVYRRVENRDGRCFHFFWRHKTNSATMTCSCAIRFDGDVDLNRTSKATYVRPISLTMKSHKLWDSLKSTSENTNVFRRQTVGWVSTDLTSTATTTSCPESCTSGSRVCTISASTESSTPTHSCVLKVFIFQDSWGMGVKMNVNCLLTSHHTTSCSCWCFGHLYLWLARREIV